MNTRQVTKLLRDTLQIQEELLEFIEATLRKMYGEEGEYAVCRFNEGLNFYDFNGCIQSICCIDSEVMQCRERKAEPKAKEE